MKWADNWMDQLLVTLDLELEQHEILIFQAIAIGAWPVIIERLNNYFGKYTCIRTITIL